MTRRDAEALLLLWLMRPKQATQPKLRALHDACNALQAGLAAATEHGKGAGTCGEGVDHVQEV